MSTLSHLACQSSKCIKKSGHKAMGRREKTVEKARTERCMGAGAGERGP